MNPPSHNGGEPGKEHKCCIEIGDYFIEPSLDRIWITHSSGEGMELTPEMIDRFYKENF